MALHRIRKGLDLPLMGAPEQTLSDAPPTREVAVLAEDFQFMKARMHVQSGDRVRLGQLLFEDRKSQGVRHTAPGSGKVLGVYRGDKRALHSVVIELDNVSHDDPVSFSSYSGAHPERLTGDKVRELLVESGQWTALRKRPFSQVPSPSSTCEAIFVTAIDTHPHAPSVDKIMEGREEDILRGLHAVCKLTDGPVYLCRAPGSKISAGTFPRVQVEEFQGPHPAGLVGTHIHLLHPVNAHHAVWHLGIQDVAAWGRLFSTGKISTERIVALTGPAVQRPRLLRTRLGADLTALTQNELIPGEVRVISGSVLSGRIAAGEALRFLGRYHQQVSCLLEGREREFLGWATPGTHKYSSIRAFASSLLPGKKFAMTTTTHGSERAMVPLGMYERVMPLDILPTFLLRSLVMGDIERSEALGCLELDEEDLALCTFVSPGKEDFGESLRELLTRIWKEG